MHVNTVAQVHQVLPALATLSQGITRTARKGKAVRLYRQDSAFLPGSSTVEALITLLQAGHAVRVYEADRIYTPALDQGQLVWSFTSSRKTRKSVTVEVVL